MKRILICILLILFSVLIISLFINNNINHTTLPPQHDNKIKENNIVEKNNLGILPKPKEHPPITIAIFGTDERKNEISRSDVIMIIKYIPMENKATLVSIPRDSKIEIPEKGQYKINAAHAFGGPELQKDILENLFDIKVDHYMKINFKGFVEIVDTIGGVKVNAKKDFLKHWDDNSVYIKKGKTVINGEQALEYVRFRHDKDGDYGRIKRQQEVIISISKGLIKPHNLLKIPKICNIIEENIHSDMNLMKMFNIARQIDDIDSIIIEQYTLKTKSRKENGIWFEIIDKENLEMLSKKLNEK